MKVKKIVILFSLFILITNPNYTQTQQFKWLRVGSLRSWFSSHGAEKELGRTGLDIQQLDGLRWDAQFLRQDTEVSKSLWIGTTNYFDRFLNQTIPHKIVSAGPRSTDPINQIFPVEFKMIGRFLSPSVTVDGVIATDNNLDDMVDEVSEALKPDRMIENILNSFIGITITRKLMAFSQGYNDNYFIYDYTFKNTGIYDINGSVEQRTLIDVYFFFQYRYAFGLEAYPLEINPPYMHWGPSNSITWGRNCVNHQIGTNPNDPDFEMRAQYSWYGRHSQGFQAPGFPPQGILGLPNHLEGGDGHISTPQFVGTITLHADKSAVDKTDDPFQPISTHHIGSDTGPQANDQFNTTLMTAKYGVMSQGHSNPTHAEMIGNGFADQFGNDAGGYAQGQGFGPYTLTPGDSIHIVLAEGIAGLSREKCYEIGANWKDGINGSITSFTLPDGTTTNEPNTYLNAWVMTGADSILQTFRRSKQNFESGYNIPQPPPPPSNFDIVTDTNKISLSWSNNAESWPNFKGYRIYRASGKPDTFYTKIFECDLNNLVNSFNDMQILHGIGYYYYIQSYDDGSTNNIIPNEPLASSEFYTMTNKPAFLRGTVSVQTANPNSFDYELMQNYPNPFNPITNFEFQIAEFGFVKLKIYDILGNEITSIISEVLPPGSYKYQWDAVGLASGVYFYCKQEIF